MIEIPGGWLRALLTILFGALAGGLTNRVAIWMLFHPYQPPRVLGRRVGWLQGAMPKNQDRLARSIGQAVGTRLLTPADVASELADPGLEAAFEERIRELVAALVEREQPALSELLSEAAAAEVRELVRGLLDELRERLIALLESPRFVDEAERLMADVAGELADEPLAGGLDPHRVDALRERADEWLGRLVESEALERTVRRQLERLADHILRPGRTLEELIPAGLVAAVEHAISDYLPLAMERLGRLLEDPQARARVERAVLDLLERFMRDLRFYQRVVAKLIITEETVNRVLGTLRDEGTDELVSLLREPEMQSAMARSVNEAVVEFLRRPTTAVLGEADDPQVIAALDAIAERVVRAVRDPAGRAFLLEQLEEAVWRVGERSWSDVLGLLPPDRVGGWLAAAIRSEPGGALLDAVAEETAHRVVDRPLGRPARFLPPETAARLADALGPAAWDWVREQIPAVAERVRVADRVEAKIQEYPLQELEGLVRSVTQHELDLIVRLGYVLGASIGTILVSITLVF